MELAPGQGLNSEECDFSPGKLTTSDEIFLTNAVIGIWPVRQLDQQRFAPGAVTRRLMDAVEAIGHA
jgi:4-amino-4-deoxychorismate lyase